MSRPAISSRARYDLRDIWRYTADIWDTEQADRYTRSIEMAISLAGTDRHRVERCGEIKRGYYRLKCEHHLAFMRKRAGQFVVVRILHERMDFRRHL